MTPNKYKPKQYLELTRRPPETDFVMIGSPDHNDPDYYDEIEAEAEIIPNMEFLGFVDLNGLAPEYVREVDRMNK
ncbi:hypothetical protein D8Y22_09685 [Salinadaptatus halalkaliphilus]|uniref:Uncharacterized protein n=2 Tax=Salinadaptatus halalkaliphilus TaxID=2419781 RepID=A0A4S3TMQ7_9EURY|nr:hypothetical protein D8Y22_09685 [Salinadaptatus halalkaliphilus]